MMNKRKKIGLIILSIIVVIGIAGFAGIYYMGKITKEALDQQVNVDIDMNKVKDGTYVGSSDGGLVKVEVEVEVKDHTITNITLLKHDNGKGKPAEVMLDDMIKKNTDQVDEVSGATTSSKTIRNAVNVALQQGLQE
ncbi:FMN-binding protein [Anaerosporobacter faecicola]|uniref:FMN-binding protein n=1 Tax=Anaerosporobacter faecicola TaxID=2718714 RepID=UPI0014391D97|nr:FMN-binding protein [Anaerosporobacter faecicola]